MMTFQFIISIVFQYKTTLISLLFAYIIFFTVKLYHRVWTLPPGPIPLPIIGNILLFRNEDTYDKVLRRITMKYGRVFTIWIGPEPIVMISDLDIGREVFSKSQFSGRPQNFLVNLFSNDKHKDFAFTSGEVWNELRKVGHNAVQKYATNRKLSLLTSDCVRDIVNDMIGREGIEKEFSSIQYINTLVNNIFTQSLFGESNSSGDEFTKYLFTSKNKNRIILWAFSSAVRLLDWRGVIQFQQLLDNTINSFKTIFQNHYQDYYESMERDFCDALITAKKEVLKGDKQLLNNLSDENLTMCIFDLFLGGTGALVVTIQWIILLITYYPEFQQIIREEIESQIGARIAIHEDINRCHFVMAFISETLRLKNLAPCGLPHSTMVSAKIGDYLIPEGNTVIVIQDIILTDEKYWPNAQQFIPQRFLENGEYIKTQHKAYNPFSFGRRMCVAEKLAITNLFLIIVNFFQSIKEYDLVLGSNGGLEADPYIGVVRSPSAYKIILRKRSE